MLFKLPLAVWIVWLSVIAAELLLSWLTYKQKLQQTLPALALYRYFSPLRRLVILACYLSLNVSGRTMVATASNLACLLSIGLCAWEVYMRTFGPRAAVPDDAFRRFVLTLSVALILCAWVTVSARSPLGGPLTHMLQRTQLAVTSMLAAAFTVIPFCAKIEGYSWRLIPAQAAAGFAFFLSFGLAFTFTGPYLSGVSYAIGLVIALASEFISALWWIGCALAPAPEPPPLITHERLDYLRGELAEMEKEMKARSVTH